VLLPPKTGASARLALDCSTVAVLTAHRATRRAQRRVLIEHGFVFAHPVGPNRELRLLCPLRQVAGSALRWLAGRGLRSNEVGCVGGAGGWRHGLVFAYGPMPANGLANDRHRETFVPGIRVLSDRCWGVGLLRMPVWDRQPWRGDHRDRGMDERGRREP
jgi:hypothetical protein